MELIQPIVVLVVGFAVEKVFALLKVEIDRGVYNAIVGSIVVYLLGIFGADQAALLF